MLYIFQHNAGFFIGYGYFILKNLYLMAIQAKVREYREKKKSETLFFLPFLLFINTGF